MERVASFHKVGVSVPDVGIVGCVSVAIAGIGRGADGEHAAGVRVVALALVKHGADRLLDQMQFGIARTGLPIDEARIRIGDLGQIAKVRIDIRRLKT